MIGSNIANFSGFVIVIFTVGFFTVGCSRVSSNDAGKIVGNKQATGESASQYEKPEIVGTISNAEIKESSGIVESRCNPNVLWTHNDSGDGAFGFAINSKGKSLATFKIPNAKSRDWEDIAAFKNRAGECFLYIGDIGDNNGRRKQITIYKIREPNASNQEATNSKNPALTEAAEIIEIKYPDSAQDAETLMVHPQTGDLYILTKKLGAPSGVYKLAANEIANSVNTLKKIADFKVPAIPNGFLTGGDISPDGKRAVVCDYFAAYEVELPKTAKNFDDIWKQEPAAIALGERAQGEACGYSADGKSIYATSEKANSPLIRVKRK